MMEIPSAAAGVSSKPVSFFFISCSASPSSGTVLKAAVGAAPAPAPGPGAGGGGGGGGGAGGGGGMVLSGYMITCCSVTLALGRHTDTGV